MGAALSGSELGDFLRQLRKQRGLSQRDLASLTVVREKPRVTASHIAQIEAYGLGAKAEKLDILIEAMDLGTDDAVRLRDLAGKPYPPPPPPSLTKDAAGVRLNQLEGAVRALREDVRALRQDVRELVGREAIRQDRNEGRQDRSEGR